MGGKYVFEKVETWTSGEYLELWARVTGKRAQYAQVAQEDYERVYGIWEEEAAVMMKFWDEVGERSWGSEEWIGTVELGVKGSLVTTEALRGLDWSRL